MAFIPHRLRDGYGLRPETVRRVLAEPLPAVIVTVDCGITAREGVACARAAGVDVIVTDHHLVRASCPTAPIVVNPRQPGCRYPEKDLAAAGIAMKLAEAVGRRAGVSLSVASLLRAAALGTIADMVPLAGENRVIAARGLAALSTCRAPGLRALLAESGVSAGIAPTSEEVAFRIAPRLNAAGRLDTALLALSLFEERDSSRAAGIARDLSVRNGERRALERRVVAEARERVEARREGGGSRETMIVEADAGWHRGVLGIAASRLAREYHRPVLLFGIDGDKASGSGRSIPASRCTDIARDPRATLRPSSAATNRRWAVRCPRRGFDELRVEAQALFVGDGVRAARSARSEADAALELEEIRPEPPGGALAPGAARLGQPAPRLRARRASRGRRSRGSGHRASRTGSRCSWRHLRAAPGGRRRSSRAWTGSGARDGLLSTGAASPAAARPSVEILERARPAESRRLRTQTATTSLRSSPGSSSWSSSRSRSGPAGSPRSGRGRAGRSGGRRSTAPERRRRSSKGSTSRSRSRESRSCASRRTARSATEPRRASLPNLYAGEKVTLTVYPDDGAPVTVLADRADLRRAHP